MLLLLLLLQGFLPGVLGTSHGALQFMAYEGLKTRYNAYRHQPPNAKFVSSALSCTGCKLGLVFCTLFLSTAAV